MLDGNHVTVVSDLHYCVICLDIYQSPADLDMPSLFKKVVALATREGRNEGGSLQLCGRDD